MQYRDLNIHFIHQFRQEELVYPCARVQQYGQFLFWQFAGRKNEIDSLGKIFAGEITDSEIINSLVSRLENKDQHACQQLSGFLKNLQKKVSLHALMEFNKPHHYRTLLAVLKPLLLSVNTYNKNGRQHLLTKLKFLLSIQPNHNGMQSPGSDEVDGLIKVMEQYVDEMYRYYSHLNTLLFRESNDSKGIPAITHMEQYLLRLISFVEKLMFATRSTQLLLGSWKKQILIRELQEVYN